MKLNLKILPMFLFKPHSLQTPIEETLNSISHAIGVIMGCIGLVLMIRNSLGSSHQVLNLWCASVFGITLITMYSASTLYHAVIDVHWKRFYKTVDHCSIYFLIAGTYTPISLIALDGKLGVYLLITIWIMALIGFIFKLLSTDKFRILSTIAYVVMGWLAIIAIEPLYHALSLYAFILLLTGGAFYSIGVIFYSIDKLRYGHVVWHIFVLLGSFSHLLLVLFYLIPH